MGFTVLIPARLASSRLPNKPLADIAGLPMVVRVALQARQSAADRVVVAADSAAIVDAVLTRADHPSGSDRLAEACIQLGLDADDLVVNVQGDEPLIDPDLIDAVAQVLANAPGASMGTAAHPIATLADYVNPNVVKVVCNTQGLAHYFSRAPIPFNRDQANTQWWSESSDNAPLRHVGIYAYKAGFLRSFPQLTPAPTEQLESLERRGAGAGQCARRWCRHPGRFGTRARLAERRLNQDISETSEV